MRAFYFFDALLFLICAMLVSRVARIGLHPDGRKAGFHAARQRCFAVCDYCMARTDANIAMFKGRA